ncbi:5-(carboxyamino)imidazole ribonucleotide synthase [Lottiidibacillus patelloidae]|uniref:N5-carboxyaminoimidazole ribonucleotide synthase n=1 Tax=Lottiidibacillus patelloidae TaxID=2670334 RepID=A0A263BRN3_9BACI|nr:5-(carboxyamino)imidazole ribonucleotide synthase [Lottiidibacillus patelloidae]
MLPGSTIGIIGGGQLGRMMAIAAKQMGYKIAVLDPKKNSPTGQIANVEIVANYSNFRAVRKLAQHCDVITYEFENVCPDVLEWLEENSYLPQGSRLIKVTQDRFYEKEEIVKSGVKVAPYQSVNSEDTLFEAIELVGLPAVLKTRQGGYDGKGQCLINSMEDIENAKELLQSGDCILEAFISFEKEISVIVNRNKNGDVTCFPVSENKHVNHILLQSIVPARIEKEIEAKAKAIALTVMEHLDVTGTLAVEMFVCKNGEIFVNELAPRPHNSGHFTLDGCATSQFEQHIRAICNWPLGNTELLKPTIMMNILGEHLDQIMQHIPKLQTSKLHLYGKEEIKPNRKMGHLNFIGEDIEKIRMEIESLGIWQLSESLVNA